MKNLLTKLLTTQPEAESPKGEDISPATYSIATAFTAVVSTALISFIGYTAVYSIISLFAGM